MPARAAHRGGLIASSAGSSIVAKHADMKRYLQSTLRAEKARQNLTWGDLSERLRSFGIRQTPTNLSTKVNRGDMGAQLLLALLSALDVRSLDIPPLADMEEAAGRIRGTETGIGAGAVPRAGKGPGP